VPALAQLVIVFEFLLKDNGKPGRMNCNRQRPQGRHLADVFVVFYYCKAKQNHRRSFALHPGLGESAPAQLARGLV
jgi:hypothetical protein